MVKHLKYKNDTADLIAEIARRMNTNPREIQKAFRSYWQDVGIIFTHSLGHGFYVHHFCHFLLFTRPSVVYCRKIAERIRVMHFMLDRYHKKIAYQFKVGVEDPPPIDESKKDVCWRIGDLVTRLIMLRLSLKLYEDEVLSKYPKKYKTKCVHLDQLLGRLMDFYHLSLSEFPLHITHPIQEVFMQKLRRKGVLSNPVVYKDTQVQPMWLHYRTKDSVLELPVPFRFLDEAK